MSKREDATITLTGILHPSAWDESGRVTGLALATDTEEEFEVEAGGDLSALLRLLSEEVAVSGRLRPGAGREVVEVSGFRRVEEVS